MARVRMLVDISGGRGDGTEWPRYGAVLECGDHEAARLVAGGHAEPDPDDAQPAVAAPEAVPAVIESPEPENDAEDDTDADPSKPRVRDAKDIWEQHAMTVHGLDVNTARSMSKKELIDAYGKSG